MADVFWAFQGHLVEKKAPKGAKTELFFTSQAWKHRAGISRERQAIWTGSAILSASWFLSAAPPPRKCLWMTIVKTLEIALGGAEGQISAENPPLNWPCMPSISHNWSGRPTMAASSRRINWSAACPRPSATQLALDSRRPASYCQNLSNFHRPSMKGML
jgi:hypothetical protein